MSIDPAKDEGLERLLQEIARNLDENQRFIKGLKDDQLDEPENVAESGETDEAFEEL